MIDTINLRVYCFSKNVNLTIGTKLVSSSLVIRDSVENYRQKYTFWIECILYRVYRTWVYAFAKFHPNPFSHSDEVANRLTGRQAELLSHYNMSMDAFSTYLQYKIKTYYKTYSKRMAAHEGFEPPTFASRPRRRDALSRPELMCQLPVMAKYAFYITPLSAFRDRPLRRHLH